MLLLVLSLRGFLDTGLLLFAADAEVGFKKSGMGLSVVSPRGCSDEISTTSRSPMCTHSECANNICTCSLKITQLPSEKSQQMTFKHTNRHRQHINASCTFCAFLGLLLWLIQYLLSITIPPSLPIVPHVVLTHCHITRSKV